MIVLGIAVAVAAAALFSISADDTRQTNTTERGPERDRSEPRVDPTDNTANTGAERKRKREQDQDQVGEEEEARGPGIVQLSLIGRLGNNLFEYAAARVVADRMGGWALSLQAAAGNKNKYSTLLRPDGMACFPGVRPLGVSQMTSPKMQALKAAPFRNLRVELKDRSPRRIVMQDWFQDYQLISEDRDRLRQVGDCSFVVYVCVGVCWVLSDWENICILFVRAWVAAVVVLAIVTCVLLCFSDNSNRRTTTMILLLLSVVVNIPGMR